MHFLIDGYNFLFYAGDEKSSLQSQRKKLIEQLHAMFKHLHLQGSLIFDGSRRLDEESGRSYESPLETIFAPKGQTADEYILEHISQIHNKKLITVVTNDKGLVRQARSAGAHAVSIGTFLQRLHKQFTNTQKTPRTPRESPQQIARLSAIFEHRLKHPTED